MKITKKHIAGWREWLALPDLGVAEIKAKLDTGARTSALHAFDVLPYENNGDLWVRFSIHPLQKNDQVAHLCDAQVIDERMVTNSGGGVETRYFIETAVKLGDETWPIEISLTNRDEMGFRMLLGRTAMKDRLLVDASGSYKLSKRIKKRRLHKKKVKQQ